MSSISSDPIKQEAKSGKTLPQGSAKSTVANSSQKQLRAFGSAAMTGFC